MFDIAWSELALIGAVALIVIGPKDLPKVMRSLGQWTRRARMMAAELQRNFDEMVREAELDELRRDVESISPAAFRSKLEDLVDVKGMEDAVRMTPAPTVSAAPTLSPAPAEAKAEPAPTPSSSPSPARETGS